MNIFRSLLLLTFTLIVGCSDVYDTFGIQSPTSIEHNVLLHLNNGDQPAAEDLVLGYLQSPLVRFKLVDVSERVLFIHATLLRSRFMIESASYSFSYLIDMGNDSLESKISKIVLNLDQKNNVEENIEKLKKIVDENPNDILLRWLLAIECRHNRIHELGAEQFSIIVKSWEPGPAVVHQSYANILIDLKQYEKALEHRYRTVELEPKRWSYTSLGNTLTYLKRYDEADSAYKKSISIADDANSWSGWAWSLYKRKAYDDAIVKAKEALRRDNGDYEAIIYWANSLEGKHYYLESLHLNRFGLALHPDNSSLVDNAIRVERKLNQIESIRDKK